MFLSNGLCWLTYIISHTILFFAATIIEHSHPVSQEVRMILRKSSLVEIQQTQLLSKNAYLCHWIRLVPRRSLENQWQTSMA
jgi:hypothetical protein